MDCFTVDQACSEPCYREYLSVLEEKLRLSKACEERYRKALIENHVLFCGLDEAMATPERITEDTKIMGCFVSGIDLIYTAEDVIERAIKIIKEKK
jgi:hypothetical protein